MSTWQQAQTSFGSESIPLSARFYPQGLPYPESDGGSSTGDDYPSSSGYSPPREQQRVILYDGLNMPPQNDSFNADNISFSDKTIRRKFIAKVFGILMCQILTTYVFAALGTYHYPFNNYIKTSIGLKIIAIVFTFGTLLAFAFSQALRRKSPINIILLFVFTLAESFLVAVSVTQYYPEQVLVALGITTLFCFGLTVFALQTKIDFTIMRGFLIITVLDLMVGIIVDYYFPSKTTTVIIGSVTAIIFSSFLLYDVRMIIGGDNNYSIAPEEYVFAAINIYVDIVNVFFHMASVIGASSDD